MMSGETALGRQYLLQAQRAEENRPGTLEPRYQVWAAWSLLEAQYPEEAERIVNRLIKSTDTLKENTQLAATIGLLQGEIARNRSSKTDLEFARTAYTNATENGDGASPAVSLRLAELTISLDGPEAGLAQIEEMREKGEMTAALEALAVSTLMDLERLEDATTALNAARLKYPDDGQLAVLESAIHVRSERVDQADIVLSNFLDSHPDDIAVAQTRARILAGPLERVDDARKLLTELAEHPG